MVNFKRHLPKPPPSKLRNLSNWFRHLSVHWNSKFVPKETSYLEKGDFCSCCNSLEFIDVLRITFFEALENFFVWPPDLVRVILLDQDVVQVFVLGQARLDRRLKGPALKLEANLRTNLKRFILFFSIYGSNLNYFLCLNQKQSY